MERANGQPQRNQNSAPDNFASEVKSGTLLVADFWAPWCGPCRQLSPVIDRVADAFAGKVKVGKSERG